MSHPERCSMCGDRSEVVLEYEWHKGTLCEGCLTLVMPFLTEAHILPLNYKRIYRPGSRRW